MNGCVVWTGYTMPNGYGQAWGNGRVTTAHRVAYERVHGPVPAGLDLDHLCRNRACVNPEHLEPVTRSENLRRGDNARVARERTACITHCPQGHAYDAANTYLHRGKRSCRNCKRVRCLARYYRLKEARN